MQEEIDFLKKKIIVFSMFTNQLQENTPFANDPYVPHDIPNQLQKYKPVRKSLKKSSESYFQ